MICLFFCLFNLQNPLKCRSHHATYETDWINMTTLPPPLPHSSTQ